MDGGTFRGLASTHYAKLQATMADREAAPETGFVDELVSPALRRRIKQCYDHATKLAEQDKPDYDYANKLLTDCVANDPGNLTYVEPFLQNLQRKYHNNKKGAAFTGFASRGAFKRALAKEDWREALKQGPLLLAANPWDVATLRGMAQACEALRFDEAELRYLKNALDANPRDIEVNKHCARTLAGVGDYDQAIACWHRIEELKKGDVEAPKMISELTIEKQRMKAGPMPAGAKTHRRPAVDRPGGSTIIQPQTAPHHEDLDESPPDDDAKRREFKLTPRQVLERDIAERPAILESYFSLADLLVGERKFDDAERTLARALHVSGGDPQIRLRLEDAQMQRARYELAIEERLARKEGTERAADLVREIRDAVNRLELEIYAARAERYPQDREINFELGVRLKRAQNYAEALKQFDLAREVKEKSALALLEAGECLQHLKGYEKALKCYIKAADSQEVDEECRKLALYRAGVLATGMKRTDDAGELLGRLAKLDSGYKDVQHRLDKLGRIRNKG
jgi:tetratricopeptide (TPR) repeat protein